MRSVGPISGREIARDGLAQQRAAAGGAAVWWGAQGFSMPRYGSFPASAAWIGNGMGYCADGTPRDLVGSKIAEAHVHWGKHRERVMVQHVVGESRQHNVVAQGSAGGTRDAGVRSVSKQDLQWMLVPSLPCLFSGVSGDHGTRAYILLDTCVTRGQIALL